MARVAHLSGRNSRPSTEVCKKAMSRRDLEGFFCVGDQVVCIGEAGQ